MLYNLFYYMSGQGFLQRGGELYCEECSLSAIAEAVPTPFYVYSSRCLVERYGELQRALAGQAHLICYALKANAQPELLRILVDAGAGAEVVSAAELALAGAVGFARESIVFSGAGKTEAELEAGLEAHIRFFIVESEGELALINRLASARGSRACVALRVHPKVDPQTHPHIATSLETAKFGVDPQTLLDLCCRLEEFPYVELTALHTHIGSQLTILEPLVETCRLMEQLVAEVRSLGVDLKEVDLGGGLGIGYGKRRAPSFDEYAALVMAFSSRVGLPLVLEPGRALVGPSGALVMRVLYVKEVHGHRFAVTDGGMNDLLRPALYDAYHRIVPVVHRDGGAKPLDVVGAVCESSDVFGRNRPLGAIEPGDALAVLDTGAYGYAMSSNYNLRSRPAEVLVEGERFRVVRRAETVEELVRRALGGSA